VVVPAHDEEPVLPALLDALARLRYPRGLFEVVVVADNCGDATARLARARGVRVLERTDAQRRGKGHALTWALAQLVPAGAHDAFVVLDADSQPDPDLLDHLDAALRRGARAAQAYCAVGNAADSWRAALMAGDLALVHFLRPLGRGALGASAGLQGNGMCLTREVLETVPWDAVSVTEDQEYHLRLVQAGFRVVFVPEARVPTIMQPTMRAARAQELRWEGGRFRLARRALPGLLRAATRQPSVRRAWACVDAALDLTTPPFALLALATAVAAGLRTAAWWWLGGSAATLAGWVVVLGGQTVYVLAGCALARVPARTYAALAVYGPLYALAKVACCLQIAAGGAQQHWVPTPRAGRRDVVVP
jgi:cellulose synthase/poly-beta-1,6-N-acetylglucosamine synthase-like glycosyltransferase